MDEQTKEQILETVIQELPTCIDNYIKRVMLAGHGLAGYSFDMLIRRTDGNVASDKMHVILASDKIGTFVQRIAGANNEQLQKIWEILNQ